MSTVVHAQPSWLAELRAAGAERFAETGLPTQRQEAWKYTGLNRLKALSFAPAPSPSRREAGGPLPSPRWGEGPRKLSLPRGETLGVRGRRG